MRRYFYMVRLFVFSIFYLCILQLGFSQNDSTKTGKTVYIFLLHDCVICQSYAPSLEILKNKYAKQFSFIGVFPNFISKPQDIALFKSTHGITFETKTDYFKSLTKKFDVKVTPEVVIYDENQNRILYKGRIDDEFYALGKRRQVVLSSDLENALNGIIKNTAYEKTTTAVGCFINFEDINQK